jgi:endo-1,4-beta-xylanase
MIVTVSGAADAAGISAIQQDIPDLHSVLDPYFPIGAAVPPKFVHPEDIHSRLLTKHFTALVASNAMKPDALQPLEGVFKWVAADRIVGFGNSAGMKVRGHTLVWHNQIPAWFFTDPGDPQKPASRDLLLSRMKTHIQTVMGHFRGEIDSWDVVNEVLSDRAGLRGDDEGSRWLGIAGPDYIDKAFLFAREADPKATLVINDYNLESDSRKRDEMASLVKTLRARKVPVDAVGMQMHISVASPSLGEIRQAIEMFGSLGVKVQITEMDVSIYSSPSETVKSPDAQLLLAQGRRFRELFDLFEEEAAKGILDMVVMWGAADDDTWRDNFPVPGRPDAPLLFDRNLQAKPAYWAIVDPARMH